MPSAMPKAITSRPNTVLFRNRQRQQGVTVVELMIGLAVAAILLAVASSSFVAIVNANRLAGTANELLATLQSARVEALRRNQRTVVCRSDDGTTCNAAVGDWGGWISFIDTNRDGIFNAGDDGFPVPLRSNIVAAPIRITGSPAVSGASNVIVFRADGMSHAAGGALLAASIGVCILTNQPVQNARDVSIASGSRISILPRNGAGACAAPPD